MNSNNSSTPAFPVGKKEWKSNAPPYVLNFTSNPPSLVVIFSYAYPSSFSTLPPPPPPGSYCTVPYLFTTFCFQTGILGNLFKNIYICFILFFSSSLPCRKDQVGRFIFFYRFNCTDPGLQLGDPAPLIGLLMIMKWIIYELRKRNEKVKMNKWSSQWTQRQWLHSSVGRASHWYREVTGSNHVEVLDVFRASLRNCINCVHCDDHVLIFIFNHWFVAVDLLTFYIFDVYTIKILRTISLVSWKK